MATQDLYMAFAYQLLCSGFEKESTEASTLCAIKTKIINIIKTSITNTILAGFLQYAQNKHKIRLYDNITQIEYMCNAIKEDLPKFKLYSAQKINISPKNQINCVYCLKRQVRTQANMGSCQLFIGNNECDYKCEKNNSNLKANKTELMKIFDGEYTSLYHLYSNPSFKWKICIQCGRRLATSTIGAYTCETCLANPYKHP